MASEYLKWKYRDVKHREKPVYTAKEKRQNWWYYNKWLVVAGIVGAFLLVDLFRTVTGMKEIHPDCAIAFISDRIMSEDEITSLENALSQYIEDGNRDGRTRVKIIPYAMPENPTVEEQIYQNYASEITLITDIEECTSFLFIMKDPDAFQKKYEVLCLPDGTQSEAVESGSDCAVAWNDSPVLRNLDIDPALAEYMSDFYIARRGFWTSKTCNNLDGSTAFFETITSKKGN